MLKPVDIGSPLKPLTLGMVLYEVFVYTLSTFFFITFCIYQRSRLIQRQEMGPPFILDFSMRLGWMDSTQGNLSSPSSSHLDLLSPGGMG